MDSNSTGAESSHRVSPVEVPLSPTAAAISPASTISTSALVLACIFTIRPMRSFLPVEELITMAPDFTVPE